MKLIMPMAGHGLRCQEKYALPKPLIEIDGRPMFATVVNRTLECIYSDISEFIFIVNLQQEKQFDISSVIKNLYSNSHVIILSDVTQGTACSFLSSLSYLSPTEPIMVANCDQLFESDADTFKPSINKHDAIIGSFVPPERNKKWGYIEMLDDDHVKQVVEKNPISDIAELGVYYWKTVDLAVKGIMSMMQKNDHIKNEFYLGTSLNHLINMGYSVGISNVTRQIPLGESADIEKYLQT